MTPRFAVATPRDVVRVSGPDAIAFLQGQLSQDVAALAEGSSAWSFLLQPTGKVDAWLRVTRTSDGELLVDVDGGHGDLVIGRLERFKLRTKVDFETLPWHCLAVRGVSADELSGTLALGPHAVVAPAAWPGIEGVDVLAPEPVRLDAVPPGTLDDLEALRIECGVPAMGRELTERTIPEEAGVVDRSVSFTKGCYTGQELVARIDSRGGNVPRRLRGLLVDGDEIPEAGTEVRVAGAEAGQVTSAAWSPWRAAVVALAYVKRDVQPPVQAVVGRGVATIEALPLLRSLG